jgi:hypothetical protein
VNVFSKQACPFARGFRPLGRGAVRDGTPEVTQLASFSAAIAAAALKYLLRPSSPTVLMPSA